MKERVQQYKTKAVLPSRPHPQENEGERSAEQPRRPGLRPEGITREDIGQAAAETPNLIPKLIPTVQGRRGSPKYEPPQSASSNPIPKLIPTVQGRRGSPKYEPPQSASSNPIPKLIPTVQGRRGSQKDSKETVNLKTATSPSVESEQESEETVNLKTEISPSVESERDTEEAINLKASPSAASKSEENPDLTQTSIQTQLKIGQPGDKYEQEADAKAAEVMKMEDPAAESEVEEESSENARQKQPLAETITPLVQRQETVGQKGNEQGKNSAKIEQKLGQGGGQPLEQETRSFMESRFGADFSGVRVHTDSAAVQMNKDLGAQAFAHGQDIYYGKGKSPGKNELTAHELTHTIQQSGGGISGAATKGTSDKSNKKNTKKGLNKTLEQEGRQAAKRGTEIAPSQPENTQKKAKIQESSEKNSPKAEPLGGKKAIASEKLNSQAETKVKENSKENNANLQPLGSPEAATLPTPEGQTTANSPGGETGAVEKAASPKVAAQQAQQGAAQPVPDNGMANQPQMNTASAGGSGATVAAPQQAAGGGGAIALDGGGEVAGGDVDEAAEAEAIQQRMAEAAPNEGNENGTLSPGEKSAAMAALQEGAVPETPVGGGGGGGTAIAEKPTPPAPAVSQSDPAAAMAALGSVAPQHLKSALGGVGAAIGNTVSQERETLAANPPTLETPGGQETPASEAEMPPAETAKPVEKAPEGADVPVQPPEPTPAAPPAPPIPAPAPAVAGDEEGKLSDADARNIQASVSQLPTTDASAPSFSAGAAPTLAMEGNADPQQLEQQRAQLTATTTEAKAKGDRERAEPMGDTEIEATLPPETLTAEIAAGKAGAAQIEGNAGAAIAEAGGGQDAAAILAREEKGSEIQAAIASAQGEIAAKRQERDAQVVQEQEKSNSAIEQLKQENSAQQEAERGKAQGEVEQLRGEWTQEQDTLINEAQTETDRLVGEGLAEVETEKTAAESEAVREIEKGEAKAEEERAKGETAAQQERQKGEEKAGGILGWVANAAASFFEGIKKAIQKAFETARQLMRAAIEGAKKLATAAIELGRKAIVGIIKRVGDAAIAIGDRVLAKFPETRDKFRKAIQQKVKDAEAAVNQLAEGLNRGIQTALDVLGKGLDFALGAMEKGMLFAVDGVKSTVDGALQFAEGALQTMGAFAALVPDIAANPGQWVSNLGAGAKDGVENHLWGAFQSQTQTWFQGKVDSILGVPSEVLQQLVAGGIDMGAIAQMAWNALKAAIPAALIGLLIEKVVSMIIPAVGAIKTIIESLVAAWGAVGSILSAFDAFIGFLKAVKGGQSGPQFGMMLAAAGIAVIDFVSNWLLKRLKKAAKKFAAKLKGIAKGLAKKFKKKKNKKGDGKSRLEDDGAQQKRNNQDVERDKVAEESLEGGHKAKVTDDGEVYVCSSCKVPKLPKDKQKEIDKASNPKKKAEIVKKEVEQNPKTPQRTKKSKKKKSNNLSDYRPGWRKSTKKELEKRYPEYFKEGKLKQNFNRRHIVSYEVIRKNLLSEVKGKTNKQVVKKLTDLGCKPKKGSKREVTQALKKCLRNMFNEPDNVWIGNAEENQKKGREISQHLSQLRKLQQKLKALQGKPKTSEISKKREDFTAQITETVNQLQDARYDLPKKGLIKAANEEKLKYYKSMLNAQQKRDLAEALGKKR
ncbi:MAG: DUF4157 domain-containing protein [Cyanobacteriota bacterium]|nr:DUF4157 domain-containing protein [Cyanobacteriota bacterium]